jgi:enoyl-CoA hydratase/carnithine racemase
LDGTVLKMSRDGAVVTLTIDDPPTRNALSAQLARELTAACATLNEDMSVGCAILTGSGDVFCSGGNVKDMYGRKNHFAGNAAEIRRTYQHGVQSVARALHELEVPIIAAVNGPAMGAGLDFAMMCNMQIASEKARFAESFIKLGLTSAAGGAWFLTRRLGMSVASELTLTGDTVDAEQALKLGIVSRVVPHDQLLPEARSLAARIVRHPLHSVRLNARLLREAARLDLPATLELASSMQAIAQQTDDQREAVAAVIEKRPPVYKGC